MKKIDEKNVDDTESSRHTNENSPEREIQFIPGTPLRVLVEPGQTVFVPSGAPGSIHLPHLERLARKYGLRKTDEEQT